MNNKYNTDINSTRNINQNGLNINQNPYITQVPNQNIQNPTTNQNGSLINGDFVKGVLIGAVATYILTNKNAQENIFKGFEKVKTLVTAAVEELKEKMEDAKAVAASRDQE